MKQKIALNYIFLSPKHAGGKDQVGLNLLKGFYENNNISDLCIICFDYSIEIIKKIAPKAELIALKMINSKTEFQRLIYICYINTIVIPKIIKKNNISLIFHLSYNTGLRKHPSISVVIPHDIKQVSHRKLSGISVPFYKYLLYKLLYYIDFKNNDGIIAISNVDRQEISEHYPKFANKIHKIYNPIDIAYPIEARKDIEDIIVAINLQFHHKNIITLIKAFELIIEKTNVNLILVGNVPKRVQYLRDYVEKHNLQKRIIFTGFVSEEEKNKLLKKSRLYVNPTLYEGFGMTAIEAMILKIPTLVSNIETNYEVTQGKAEYYAPAENYSALAEQIMYCLNKDITDEELTTKSNELYEAYNYKYISKCYMDYFIKIRNCL